MDLAAYRASAEAFSSELTRPITAITPVSTPSTRSSRSTSATRSCSTGRRSMACASWSPLRAGATDERRRLTMLLDFAVQGYIGQATKELDAELARRESGLSLRGRRPRRSDSGTPSSLQANEPDAGAAGGDRAAAAGRDRRAPQSALLRADLPPARSRGVARIRQLSGDVPAVQGNRPRPRSRRRRTRSRRQPQTSYPAVLEPELRRTLGLGIADLRRSDLPALLPRGRRGRAVPSRPAVASMLETYARAGHRRAGERGPRRRGPAEQVATRLLRARCACRRRSIW